MLTKLSNDEWAQLDFCERECYLAGRNGLYFRRCGMTDRENEAYWRGQVDSTNRGGSPSSIKQATATAAAMGLAMT